MKQQFTMALLTSLVVASVAPAMASDVTKCKNIKAMIDYELTEINKIFDGISSRKEADEAMLKVNFKATSAANWSTIYLAKCK